MVSAMLCSGMCRKSLLVLEIVSTCAWDACRQDAKKKPELRGRETPRTGGCDAFGVPAPRVETRAGPIAVVPCRFDAFALHARPE